MSCHLVRGDSSLEKKKRINFHWGFMPEKQYISAILDISDRDEYLSVQEISADTGIPNGGISGKVIPHIWYAKYMGLIDFEKKEKKYLLKKTKLGELILQEDFGLQEPLSLLLCHAMIVRKKNGADVWHVIFHEILPQYHSTIKKDLLMREVEQRFNTKVTMKTLTPFFRSYEKMFFDIGILSVSDDKIQLLKASFNQDFIYVYAYILFEYWDEKFENQQEISSIQLDELQFEKTFGWTKQEEYEILEHLSDKGFIRLNRQLMPYTILRLVEKEHILKKLYSELC